MEVSEFVEEDNKLKGVQCQGQKKEYNPLFFPVDAVFVAIGHEPNTKVLASS